MSGRHDTVGASDRPCTGPLASAVLEPTLATEKRPQLLIATTLRNAAEGYGLLSSYQQEDVTVTLADHLAEAEGIAAWLAREHGVRPGDRIAVLAQTSRRYVALYHAAILGYFVIVPLNTRLAAPELDYILANAAPRFLLADEALMPVAETLARALVLGRIALRDLVTAPADAIEPPVPSEAGVVALLYTGGTTGHPKGVIFTQREMAVLVHRLQFLWDVFSDETCLYASTALYHVSGINTVIGPVLTGGRTILAPVFDVGRLVEDSRTYRITHLVLVALMIDRFLDAIEHEPERHRHIRCIAYGGAPVSAALMARMKRLLPLATLGQSYGMTEALGSVSLLTNADHLRGGDLLRSAGRPLPGCSITAHRADGTQCAPDEAGELWIRTDTMMAGYWGDGAATAAAIRDGRYRSGDIGYINALGYVFVVDRAKDMIVTGGENVYSIEVERAIEALPGVGQVAVIGIPSTVWGEQVHAIVVPLPGSEVTEAAIRGGLTGVLASYKQPKSIEIRSQPLPVSGNNKVVKAALREPFWRNLDRAVN